MGQKPRGNEESFNPPCLSLDLEVTVENPHIHEFAAVRGDNGESLCHKATKKDIAAKLKELDDFARGAEFLLGHNIVKFDIPHLRAVAPKLKLLELPVVDTLWLNPLAFPRNPYHRLVKHYQDGGLHRGQLNNPKLDADLALDVFRNQRQAFGKLQAQTPELLLAWHWLTTCNGAAPGVDRFFRSVRGTSRPTDEAAVTAIEQYLRGRGCVTSAHEATAGAGRYGWSLSYTMAWLSVAGGNSVMPPWVRHQFPDAGRWVRKLRDRPCQDAGCAWCQEYHDVHKELKRWFGFDGFRPKPADKQGQPLQEVITESAMRGEHVLGVLPTGTGKSLCYQLPALSRYEKTGALTLVISPLVALMADQVAGLEKAGIKTCAALNGLLSMPERQDVLDRVRLGDIGILIVSPEQLRGQGFRRALKQREVGAWVLDEAHCVSKWGHDFRPDYRYIGRFIKEWSGEEPVAPVLCLTATAKQGVIEDIIGYFKDKAGIRLARHDGGMERDNLDFYVVPTESATKYSDIHQLIEEHLPEGETGGVIVYCATRKQTGDVAAFLSEKGLKAEGFHAGLPPERKKTIQDDFIKGDLRVIAATNAFGMGIDKPDVRLVIHADIPGSLENYLQEAGRAGRDRKEARCVLLYSRDDVERQFSMSAYSRLSRRDIAAILRSLRRLDRKKRKHPDEDMVVATSGEILGEERDAVFERDSATDDTRVRTALLWLEESDLLKREENRVQVFPSSLRVNSVGAAQACLDGSNIAAGYKKQLLNIVSKLMSANADEGISTDELMGVSGLRRERVRHALYDLENLGISRNDTALTAYIHHGVQRASKNRLEEAAQLESGLLGRMRENAPDMGPGQESILHLRHTSQRLKDAGHENALPDKLWRLLKGLSMDGRDDEGGKGSIRVKMLDRETARVTLQRSWDDIEKTASRRRAGAVVLLERLLKTLPEGARGNDLLAKTTLGELRKAIDKDMELRTLNIKNPAKLIDHALLWLHEQEAIRLNKGMAVFRPAMKIALSEGNRGFSQADFAPLSDHYQECVLQIHVMAEYARRGLETKTMAEALELTMDYFTMAQSDFTQKWLPDRAKEIGRQTTPESWLEIVEGLNNPKQQRIVSDDREQTNVLVLAGPGSGKTRVLVHRIAYLVRIRRENPKGILALVYNRHAALEIRRRLKSLIGDDARGVTVMTCHALAMRMVGSSLVGRNADADSGSFDEILRQAVALLKGEGLPPDEADEQRERLLAGFRWILVDEYQDVGREEYDLISAVAGRTLDDPDGRLSLFAVGDDDQNIYAFSGASVKYIRQFKKDYSAKLGYLTENYRSTRNIIEASNQVIGLARNRMKEKHPITVDRDRVKAPAGGEWESLDPVSRGRVQVLSSARRQAEQAVVAMQELERLATLDKDWDWSKVAVIAREWKFLDPVRSYCELNKIPVEMANDEAPPVWRLRETQELVGWIQQRDSGLVAIADIQEWLDTRDAGPWWEQLKEMVSTLELEIGDAEMAVDYFIEWLVEWGREFRRSQKGLLLLTAHRAKGLEFDHVVVLDGGWEKTSKGEDCDAPRRLYYVAMSRAKQTLSLLRFEDATHPVLDAIDTGSDPFIERTTHADPDQFGSGAVKEGDGGYTDRHSQGRYDSRLDRRYLPLTLGEVDIGYAGRQNGSAIHAAISLVSAGDEIKLRKQGDRWLLMDLEGRRVGRLAKSFSPPSNMRLESASVQAVLWRRREDGDAKPEYQALVKSDEWEVVLPELVYAAN